MNIINKLSHDFSRAIWNKQALINFFQRPQIALALRARVILLAFEKNYLCLFIPNCTRNHVITSTNCVLYDRIENDSIPHTCLKMVLSTYFLYLFNRFLTIAT